MNSKIQLSPPVLTGDELLYIKDAIASNMIANHGENINSFEKQLKEYLDVSEVVAVNSGTSAIHLALVVLGVQPDDEIICQSFTFSATANPIVYLGAKPVFVDSEHDTWNMCPTLLEEAIQDRIKGGRKPKAIITVHLYGMPYKTAEIGAIAKKYDIPVVEDAAEALGSHVDGRFCGSYGDLAIFSFNGNKIITSGSGGAIVCRSRLEKEHFIYLATQAKDNAPHYQHSSIGYNYRMSNVSAGIGRAQFERLNYHIENKRRIYAYYKANLNERFEFLDEPVSYFSNRWLTCLLCPTHELREKIRIALNDEQIEAKPLWKPLHLQPIFQNYSSYLNGNSDDLFSRGLCIPSGIELIENELLKITTCINAALLIPNDL